MADFRGELNSYPADKPAAGAIADLFSPWKNGDGKSCILAQKPGFTKRMPRIEEFHKAWKSGARVEKLRMQCQDNMIRIVVILALAEHCSNTEMGLRGHYQAGWLYKHQAHGTNRLGYDLGWLVSIERESQQLSPAQRGRFLKGDQIKRQPCGRESGEDILFSISHASPGFKLPVPDT